MVTTAETNYWGTYSGSPNAAPRPEDHRSIAALGKLYRRSARVQVRALETPGAVVT